MQSFISLGASVNQLPLILAAKKKGHKVVAVDIDPNAVGVPFADYYVQCSLLADPKELIPLLSELAHAEKLDYCGCYSRSFGAVHATVAVVADYFGLPYLDYYWVETTCDKLLMRKFLHTKKITQPNWYQVTDDGLLDAENKTTSLTNLFTNSSRYVLKPTTGHGKQGVLLINNQAELASAIKKVLSPRRQTFIVEEFIDGPELTILAWCVQGKLLPIQSITKHTKTQSPFLEIAHSVPSYVDDLEFFKRIHTNINLVWEKQTAPESDINLNASEIETGYQQLLDSVAAALPDTIQAPVLIETKYEAGVFKVIELNFEVGGEYLADFILPAVNNYDYFLDLVGLVSKAGAAPVVHAQSGYGLIGFGFTDPKGKLCKINLVDMHQNLTHDFYQKFKPAKGKPITGNADRGWVFGLKRASADELIADTKTLGWDNWQS